MLLAGRNRRVLTDRERRIQLVAKAMAVFLLFSTVCIFVLYIVKTALGIDLIPGFSFGVRGWFQKELLRRTTQPTPPART